MEEDRLRGCLNKILRYAEGKEWKGYDPYDGLLSPIGKLPFPFYRLVFQQIIKRSPAGIRKLLFIPESHNPKGLALFLWAYALLKEEKKAREVFDLLMSYRSEIPGGIAFGYNFDWQSSVFYVPAFTPNVIATSFSIFAIKEAKDSFGWDYDLRVFLPFYERVLKQFKDERGHIWMSYTPFDELKIFNSSILGAVAYAIAGGKRDVLEGVADTLAEYQGRNGEWVYGLERRRMNYVDHIHTAYNLWGLKWASEMLGKDKWDEAIERGYSFYRENLFNESGLPRGRLKTDSFDTHDISAAIITLKMFGEDREAKKLAEYACSNLVGDDGEVYNGPKDKRVFMRWSVGWLSLSLAYLLR